MKLITHWGILLFLFQYTWFNEASDFEKALSIYYLHYSHQTKHNPFTNFHNYRWMVLIVDCNIITERFDN